MLEQIKASAGSGKTHTLTLRFLDLLTQSVSEPSCALCSSLAKQEQSSASSFSEILAMTFTNKAANEMKTRVLTALKCIALGQNAQNFESIKLDSSLANQWVFNILKRYDALNIRTIDSFLHSITKNSAISLKLNPDFEITFDNDEYLIPLYDSILDNALVGDEESLKLITDCAENLVYFNKIIGFAPQRRIKEHILKILALMQTKKDFFSHFKNESSENFLFTDEQKLKEIMDGGAKRIRESAENFQKALILAKVIPVSNFTKALTRCLEYEASQDFTQTYLHKNSIAKCLPKTQQSLVTQELEDAYSLFSLKCLTELNLLKALNSTLFMLPFAKIINKLLTGLSSLHQNSRSLPNTIIPMLAENALNAEFGVSEACCRLGTRLKHLLIDEFQDTSRVHWAALEPLAEECLARGGSVRYVGDSKQAIYSWRGGDSSLFDEIGESQNLRNIEKKLNITELEFNWRSSKTVIDFNNQFFEQLENNEASAEVCKALFALTYPQNELNNAATVLRKTFLNSRQKYPEHKKSLPNGFPQGFVQVNKFYTQSSEQLNEKIKIKLHKLFQEDLIARHNLKDITVLVRTKAEAALIADWLSEIMISVVTDHSFKLAAHPLIFGLISFLKFLDYPSDNLSFWEFITNKECFGLTSKLDEQTLNNWLVKKRLNLAGLDQKNQAIFKYFKEDFPEIWAELIEPFYNQAGLMNVYDILSELSRHYKILELSAQDQSYLQRFLELVHSAQLKGYSSISAFLEFWNKEGLKETVPSSENLNAVQIMTMHTAKGLEFPVVIIPFHLFRTPPSTNFQISKFNDSNILTFDMPEVNENYYKQKNIAELENLQLTYVAWTRACLELHLFIGIDQRALAYPGLGRALNFLFQNYDFEGDLEDACYSLGSKSSSKQDLSATNTEKKADSYQVKEELLSLTLNKPLEFDTNWHPMGWLPKLKIFTNPISESEYDERSRGIFIHNCLENISVTKQLLSFEEQKLKSSSEFNTLLTNTLNQLIDYNLHAFSLPLEQVEGLRNDTFKMLFWFCSQAQSLSWLKNGYREQNILDDDNKLYRLDLLVKSEQEYLIIDYKSGTANTQNTEQVKKYLHLFLKSGLKAKGKIVYLEQQFIEEVML